MSGRTEPDWQEPSEVHLTRIDVPFLDLTWFFVKASMAMAVAFLVTSWLWVVIGTGVVALTSGLLLLLGVPSWFEVPEPAAPTAALVAPAPPQVVVVTPAPVVAEPEPEPVAEPEPAEPPAEPARGPAADPNAAATEAMQRAELERLRKERQR